MGKWSRRAFITAGTLLGGGVVVGVGGIAFSPNRFAMVPEEEDANETSVTTWVKITPDNKIIALIPHCEMGQGAQTGIAMMLAEELEADWNQVVIREAPAESLYANGHLIAGLAAETVNIPSWLEKALQFASYKISDIVGMQVTGGSMSTRATGLHGMRIAGAAAKEMLLEAAALKWNVAAAGCVAKNSRVINVTGTESLSYGELADIAGLLAPPTQPKLKAREYYTLVGTSQQRPDIPAKVDGSTQYGIDTAVEDMLYASIKAAPIQGGLLTSIDDFSLAEVMVMPGVQEVVRLENAVAVVADGYWQASQALKALKINFSRPEVYYNNIDELDFQYGQLLDANQGGKEVDEGDGAEALVAADKTVAAEYFVPYLAHATMEPMAATAWYDKDGFCEIWAGTQDPLGAKGAAAKVLDIEAENITFHNAHSGGGFGRRLPGSFDYIEQAVEIARVMSPTPVKLIWSREEDMQQDYYRPATVARFQGGLDVSGAAETWSCIYNRPAELGAATPPYVIPNQEVRTNDPVGHLREGSWRSVAHSQHGFFIESFADELAVAAGQDPYEYRMAMLRGKLRHQLALTKVAQMSNWESPLPVGRGRGIAIVEAFGTICAEVAEVSVDANGKIKVLNVYAAVDCGLVVNPNQALAQIEGGILFGLSAALYQEITLDAGVVEQSNFTDYPMVKLADAPRVHVEFIESDAKMGGLGEPGVPPVAPAVANAVYAATGTRLRRLPLKIPV